MKLWRGITLLLIVAAAAAFAWHWLAADPGEVRIHIHGIALETSVVIAVVALFLAGMLLVICWQILRWPFRTWGRAAKRRGRKHFVGGLLAFAEGEYARAERALSKAANHAAFRTPALLLLAHAAHARGADDRARQALDKIGDNRATDALRARILIDDDRNADALALLKEKKVDKRLSLHGEKLLIDAALATGNISAALDSLPVLARNKSLSEADRTALETRVLAVALATAPDTDTLAMYWNKITRAQRKRPQLAAAYARRAAAFGNTSAAMDEIESAQRHGWSDVLFAAYGDLGSAEAEARLRQAQAWLTVAPDNVALLTTIGRLYGLCSQWTQAVATLERALAIEASPQAWEALGDCHSGMGDLATANTCYANALRLKRGESVALLAAHAPEPEPEEATAAIPASVLEERSEHGVPHLPDAE